MAGSVGQGRKTVTAAGTAVQLAAAGTASTQSVALTALSTNTGLIAVGGSGVLATPAGSRTGVVLSAGQSASFDVDDLSDVWIDATVNGEGVTYAYTQR